jgi:hypothetical protein
VLSGMKSHDLGALLDFVQGEVAQARGQLQKPSNPGRGAIKKSVDPLLALETSQDW